MLAAIGLGAMRCSSAVPEIQKLATEVDGDPIIRAHAIMSLARLSDTAFVGMALPERESRTRAATCSGRRRSRSACSRRRNDEGTARRPDPARTTRRRIAPVRNFSLIALGQIGTRAARALLLQRARERTARTTHVRGASPRGSAPRGIRIAGTRSARPCSGAGTRCRTKEIERGAFAVGLGLAGPSSRRFPAGGGMEEREAPEAPRPPRDGARDCSARRRRLAHPRALDGRSDWDAQTRARKALGLLAVLRIDHDAGRCDPHSGPEPALSELAAPPSASR